MSSSNGKLKNIEKKDVKIAKKPKKIEVLSDSDDEELVKVNKKKNAVDNKKNKEMIIAPQMEPEMKKNNEVLDNSDNEKDKKDKSSKGKTNIFREERLVVLEKLNKIVDIEGEKGFFCVDDINGDQKKAILNLVNDVKKFFVYGNWGYFKDLEGDKAIISLIKSIYKDMGYDVNQNVSYKTVKGVRTAKVNILIEKQE